MTTQRGASMQARNSLLRNRGNRQAGGRPPHAARMPARDGSTTATSAQPDRGSWLVGVGEGAAALSAMWAPTAARVLLGLVMAWFGYHELVQPSLWTGYVPIVGPQSSVAAVLVLGHGWVLLIVAVALVAGIMPRLAAAAAAALVLEIVISLTVTGGLSDLTLRDVGVLGLAIAVASPAQQRLTLKG